MATATKETKEAKKETVEEQTTAEVSEELDGESPGETPGKKEELYQQIAKRLNAKVEKVFAPVAKRVKEQKEMDIHLRQVFGTRDARDLLVAMFDGLFEILTKPEENGVVRPASVGIPSGYGSMQLTVAAATTKKTPQGKLVSAPDRWRVKYSPGKSIDDRLAKLPPPPGGAPAPPIPSGSGAASVPPSEKKTK